ncbi:MAG: uracil-DNA glycosylase [Nitrospira bacterium HGW-Nitrospira-1]|nr:MAG: uracil-DNA glycosylase [Nitrospira bacterium HGW-Nitrospira-1]
MHNQRASVIQDVKRMLEYYQALGFDSMPFSTKALLGAAGRSADGKIADLMHLREEIGICRRCKLSQGRKNIVFGTGNADARIMFIGEAPGKDEDLQGEPFVGEAGMLLTNLIEKMGFKRETVYIANIIKCRPPMNRDPEEDEILSCRTFLDKQIDVIAPEFIITLGRIALMTLTNNNKIKITAARGNFFEYKGVPVMPTFHPAYLLRNPKDKWLTWADVQKVLERMNNSNS